MTPDQVDAILFGAALRSPDDSSPPATRNRATNVRFTQETPILPEVWYEFAANPRDTEKRVDTLITPYGGLAANRLLVDLAMPRRPRLLDPDQARRERLPDAARPFALRNFVAIALTFDEMINLVLPRTDWAIKAIEWLGIEIEKAKDDSPGASGTAKPLSTRRFESPFETQRIITLIGAILFERSLCKEGGEIPPTLPFDGTWAYGLDAMQRVARERDAIGRAAARRDPTGGKPKPSIWRVAFNRSLDLSDEQARTTVKADAAFRVFDVKCDSITWAVVDSGIDQTHPAFNDDAGNCRVIGTYDFSRLRDLLDVSYYRRERENPRLEEACRLAKISVAQGVKMLKAVHLATIATDGVNWAAIENLIRLDKTMIPEPAGEHGTHVAGIIGADWRDTDDNKTPIVIGMAPDVKLYDLRILAGDVEQTEDAVIAALQFVSYLNRRNDRIAVHGVNLSLSIRHAVKNYACGRTPVCDECDHLVGGGTVVVAAAGNFGYAGSLDGQSATDGYVTARITDPGNTDSVITVGATHKREPHTYGISYFSSRGPTGDGRMKPDLVAPGEGIRSTLPQERYGPLDGTSQATPHVSGAAALLMGRFPELIGQPREIKRLLCESATDLGRERAYQGHGLLDVLRALQSY